ncbi:MAG TPA: hypothetical protein VFQ44_17290 [Streptosporangiaceae bacterium]|nr:hypothetical protein [Streptosporangiaceae bacterium]
MPRSGRERVGGVVDGSEHGGDVGHAGRESGWRPGFRVFGAGRCPERVGEGETAQADNQVAGVGDDR